VSSPEWTLAGVLGVFLGQGLLAAIVLRVIHALGNSVTKSFVDVVRYLDSSPRSYEQRRNIRKGMVDLLQALHGKDRYSRIVIVSHSLGAYIAYDAIAYLWPEMCKLHAGPLSHEAPPDLPELTALEAQAEVVFRHPTQNLSAQQRAELTTFRDRQLDLWKALRLHGNPWLITDLVTLGTPMYFADLLYARNRADLRPTGADCAVPDLPTQARLPAGGATGPPRG